MDTPDDRCSCGSRSRFDNRKKIPRQFRVATRLDVRVEKRDSKPCQQGSIFFAVVDETVTVRTAAPPVRGPGVGRTPISGPIPRMLQNGTRPNLAKVTLARKLAAMTLAMWKRKEAYDSAKYHKPSS